MRVVALVLVLAACSWGARDIAIQSAATGAMALDWAQTRTTVAPSCTESNPVLGHCPAGPVVDVYFLIVAVAQVVIAAALPESWRAVWSTFVLGIEATTVYHNFRMGAGIRP